MDSFSDEALILEFVTESQEHLANIEPDFLTMEKDGADTDQEIINRIFRAIHSIKGASGFFGLDAIKKLSHVMESLLMQIRDRKIVPNSEVIEPLLLGVDKLNVMMEDVGNSESVAYGDIVTRLEAILNGGGAPVEAEKATVAVATAPDNNGESSQKQSGFEPDLALVQSLTAQGNKFFNIHVMMEEDLTQKKRSPVEFCSTLSTLGQILDTQWDTNSFTNLEHCLEKSFVFQVLYASVLDIDLVSEAIDIPQERLHVMNVVDGGLSQADGNVASAAPVSVAPSVATAAPEVPAPAAPETQAPEPEAKTEAAPPEKQAAEPTKKAATPSADANESVRVRVDLLNRLMDLAGEMVLSRNQLLRMLSTETNRVNGLNNVLQNINFITTDLQEHIMQTRMQPIGSVFGKFPRIVRDLAKQLGKEIRLETFGEDVELDKSIIESLSDPLTHLIRNCCDHALEPVDERIKVGKDPVGTITLKAYHEDGQINIAIMDDGRGIDAQRIASKAIKNGQVTEAEVSKMSQQEMLNLIFLPGLSTAETISEVSGRGVGTDVVKTNISKLGGTITIETEMGMGTMMLLKLPLTLAIIPSLIVGVQEYRFAVPQINLLEVVCVKAEDISSRVEKVGTANVLRLRDKLLPLVRLADVLGLDREFVHPETEEVLPDQRKEIADVRYALTEIDRHAEVESNLLNKRGNSQSDYNILVLKVGGNQYGLILDELFDSEEIVVKPLSNFLKDCKCFAGSTILGDGRVSMILDPGGILNYAGVCFEKIEAQQRLHAQEIRTRMANRSILIFHNSKEERFAIPLASVHRLEKFKLSDIQRVGRDEFLTYCGKGLPLIRLENYLPVNPMPNDSDDAYLIIPNEGFGSAGIVVSEIIDTMDTEVVLEKSAAGSRGISGSAVINDHLTMFIEAQGLLEQAGISA